MQGYRPYAVTQRQKEILEARITTTSNILTAKKLGITRQSVDAAMTKIINLAAQSGYAPDHDLTRPAAPGFATKRVSTAYNKDGDIALQWHVQEPVLKTLEAIEERLISVFSVVKGNYQVEPAPPINNCDLASCYLIGDHHFGMYAWSDETGGDDYDTDIAEKLLTAATTKLIERSPDSELGVLVNLGDFLHANDSTSTTPASKNALDTDGRMGRVGRRAALLLKTSLN